MKTYSTRVRARGPKQQSFFPPEPKFFGGALLVGRRRRQRPLSFKRPIHFVLRSTKAAGRWSFLHRSNRKCILGWLAHFEKRTGLKIYEKAVVSNHLHLLVRLPDRKSYNRFIRAFSGTLPRSVFRFEDPTESFWDHRPFSRVLEWGRDYRRAKAYVIQNEREAQGEISFQPRGKSRYLCWDEGGVGRVAVGTVMSNRINQKN